MGSAAAAAHRNWGSFGGGSRQSEVQTPRMGQTFFWRRPPPDWTLPALPTHGLGRQIKDWRAARVYRRVLLRGMGGRSGCKERRVIPSSTRELRRARERSDEARRKIVRRFAASPASIRFHWRETTQTRLLRREATFHYPFRLSFRSIVVHTFSNQSTSVIQSVSQSIHTRGARLSIEGGGRLVVSCCCVAPFVSFRSRLTTPLLLVVAPPSRGRTPPPACVCV